MSIARLKLSTALLDGWRSPLPWAKCVALSLALTCNQVAADAGALDLAVKKYYAGQPDAAVNLLEPLATAGDADAQYLLGNILYTLAQSGQPAGDPLHWYRLAAAQDSASANFALGTLFQNRWLQSRQDKDADESQHYFQRAAELGEPNAQGALDKLAAHRRTIANSNSLTYNNDSFSSKRVVPKKKAPTKQAPPIARRQPAQPVTSLDQLLARFESSGDPVEDAQRLKKLLGQVDEQALADTESGAAGSLFGSFDSAADLLGKLIKLYGHIETATELSTAPGAK